MVVPGQGCCRVRLIAEAHNKRKASEEQLRQLLGVLQNKFGLLLFLILHF